MKYLHLLVNSFFATAWRRVAWIQSTILLLLGTTLTTLLAVTPAQAGFIGPVLINIDFDGVTLVGGFFIVFRGRGDPPIVDTTNFYNNYFANPHDPLGQPTLSSDSMIAGATDVNFPTGSGMVLSRPTTDSHPGFQICTTDGCGNTAPPGPVL